jgi:hypothetical protein
MCRVVRIVDGAGALVSSSTSVLIAVAFELPRPAWKAPEGLAFSMPFRAARDAAQPREA